MKVGDKFYSYEEFEKKLKKYESTVDNKFWVRDCLTLKTQALRYPNGAAAQADPKLKYSHILFSCVLGGREHNVTGMKRTSLKQGCQAGITVRLNKSGEYLEVVNLNESHNHFHSNHLTKMPELKSEEFKYKVNIDDFCKLAENDDLKEEFYKCVELLKMKYNCNVSVLCDECEDVVCVFFQSNEMKAMFDVFPDLLYIEGVNNSTDSVVTYLFMVEDSEGCGWVVGVAIMLQIEDEVIDWLIKEFFEENSSFDKIKFVMGERGCVLAKSIAAKYPNIKLEIPLFHSLSHIKQEINQHILKITAKEREEIIKQWKNVLLSISDEIYKKELNNLKKVAPKAVINYFQKTWQPIKDQWVLFQTSNYRLMLNKTNNRVENIRQSFKSVITTFTNFSEFIKMLFVCIATIKNQHNTQFSEESKFIPDPKIPHDLYRQYLTKYAYEKVETELKEAGNCNNLQIIEIDRAFAPSPEGAVLVRQNSCNCLFWLHMQLPCRHILKFRSIVYLPLFENNLCCEKWTQKYYRENIIDGLLLNKEKKMENLKFVADAIAKACAEVPMNVYSKRLNYIKDLKRKWIDETDVEEQQC